MQELFHIQEVWTSKKMKILIGYAALMNLLGFFIMGEDKRRARKKLWRIPEKTLFLCSFLGGSIGTWAGMYVFHHKTKHWYFVVGMPLILFLQAGILVYLVYLYNL